MLAPLKVSFLLSISILSAAPQIGIYLVPWDYDGPISEYYIEWGGTKPHATIVGFVSQRKNINDAARFVANQSIRAGRWDFSCSKNKCTVERTSSLQLMKFYAQTVTNISNILKKMGIADVHNPSPCHITLCKTSETSFSISDAINALEEARDWRLVVVEKDGAQVTWKNSYDV